MKLLYSPLSPFARKVLVVLAEKGLDGEVETEVVNPWEEPEALTAINPISQVPALLLPDGTTLYDSAVIAHYLDTLADPRLIPPGGVEHWRVRRTEAAADAICDTVVKLRQEALRPESERSAHHGARWRRSVSRALDALEAEGAEGGARPRRDHAGDHARLRGLPRSRARLAQWAAEPPGPLEAARRPPELPRDRARLGTPGRLRRLEPRTRRP